MNDLLRELQSRGCKVTPQRRLILEILEEAGKHLSAEEIGSLARVKQPNLSVGTVYRNLNILCDLGLVRRVDFLERGNRYEINGAHHHHLVCLSCGDAVEIDFCPIENVMAGIIKGSGFEVSAHKFEVTGYCLKCKGMKKHAR